MVWMVVKPEASRGLLDHWPGECSTVTDICTILFVCIVMLILYTVRTMW